MRYIHNPQLVTSYDYITADQVVLGETSPERYVSAQPAGWEAILSNAVTIVDEVPQLGDLQWKVRDMNKPDSVVFTCPNIDSVKDNIATQHNKDIKDFFGQAAVNWKKYYDENPIDKNNANPQTIASIYRCAAIQEALADKK